MKENSIAENNDVIRDGKKQKKAVIIAIVITVSVIILLAVAVRLLEHFNGNGNDGKETVGTVPPSDLEDTKEEDFDIMEYDEYLRLDRNIYYEDKGTGVTVSIGDDDVARQGKGFEVVYGVLKAINRGDASEYDSYMGAAELKKGSFTQQQIYDIRVGKYSVDTVNAANGGSYTEYVFEIRYKIHENNGSFRKDIGSDASRKHYYVINDSSGELLVMDIIYTK